METRKIKISDIELNEGQVEGLPSNPRQWAKAELEVLKKSIAETIAKGNSAVPCGK